MKAKLLKVRCLLRTDLFGVYPGEFVTVSCRISVLTHCIMNGMCDCINSFVHHVSDSELRCVCVLALECLYVFRSITHSLVYGLT